MYFQVPSTYVYVCVYVDLWIQMSCHLWIQFNELSFMNSVQWTNLFQQELLDVSFFLSVDWKETQQQFQGIFRPNFFWLNFMNQKSTAEPLKVVENVVWAVQGWARGIWSTGGVERACK